MILVSREGEAFEVGWMVICLAVNGREGGGFDIRGKKGEWGRDV